MAESMANSKNTSGGSGRKQLDYSTMVPKAIPREDAMSPSECAGFWAKIYARVGCASSGEEGKASVRLAIYTYLAVNGCSRDGNYSGIITDSTGRDIEAAVIPNVLGSQRIRKFARGNMNEAYEMLKASKAVEFDERYVAYVGQFGVSPELAFATADYFRSYPGFTPAEKRAHEIVLNYSLRRANGARGGRSLDDVEKTRVDSSLEAQRDYTPVETF